MNWSCIIVGATIIFPGLHWLFSARHKYLKFSNTVWKDNVIVVDGERRAATDFVK
jgi:choline transport protein